MRVAPSPPASPRANTSPLPPPRLAWPSQGEFAAAARAAGQERCDKALERYYQAKRDVAALALAQEAQPKWPADPRLLHPDMQASCVRRLEHQAGMLVAKKTHLNTLWKAYVAEGAQAARVDQVVNLMPPPRLADLVGGLEAFAALPDVSRSLEAEPLRLLQPLPHPLARGQDSQGRLFLAISFVQMHAAANASKNISDSPATPGIVVLQQVLREPTSPWVMANPQRFVPPGRLWRGSLAPIFPNMAGRGALVGGPDAQAILKALKELTATGSLGPYRLMAPPGPSEMHAL